MDNTTNKFWLQVQSYYNTKYNKNITINREDLKSFNIMSTVDDTDGEQRLNEIFCTPGFWETMPIYDGCKEAIKILSTRYDVRILSSPWPKYDACCTEKIRWVKQNLPFIDPSKIIFSSDKSIIMGDLLIDDAPINLTSFKFKKIAIDYPYNEGIDVDFRTRNWEDISSIVDKMFEYHCEWCGDLSWTHNKTGEYIHKYICPNRKSEHHQENYPQLYV